MSKRIVICGSMKFKESIFRVSEELQQKGYEVLIPEEAIRDMKKEEASKLHFNKVADDKTDAIIAINENKKDITNYIGPNTFAEIGLAFYKDKKIYLLNDIYEPYRDELEGWNAICLNGDLNKIEL